MIICLLKRKNYRTFIYTALVITLCLLIIALLWPKRSTVRRSESKCSDSDARESGEDVKTPQDKDEDNGDKQAGASGDGRMTKSLTSVKKHNHIM